MIKQGFMIVIESGDMGDTNTCTKTGLSAMEAEWHHAVFNAWGSREDRDENDLPEFVKIIKEVCEQGGYVPKEYSEYLNPDFDQDSISDIAYELFGAACEYTGCIRSPQSFKMYYIPCDIPEISGSK